MLRTTIGMRALVRSSIVAMMVAAFGCTPSTQHASSTPSASPPARIVIHYAPTATWPPHPSDAWRLAKIAVDRLGGARAASAPQVTGVSIAGGYGLAVYQIAGSTQECLFLKEKGAWRVLGTDGYFPNGRGLVHFGLSQAFANTLIAGLHPPPPR
jgi:hypothetical protein